MIKATTIQAVKDRMDIIDITSQFLKLKKRGANSIACCPFHAEKTESFTVSPAKQIYKCFGCGKSGDAITFIIEHEKKTYPEAIEWLASHYHIAVEIEEETPEKKEAREKAKDQKALYQSIIQFAADKYHNNLLSAKSEQLKASSYLTDRGITEETIQFWGIGHAPEQWQYISSDIISRGWYEHAKQLGLIKTHDGKTFDFYRNRITIPLHDHNGNIIGIAGRLLPVAQQDAQSVQPKYINPAESILYNKSKILFGLDKAITAKAFQKPCVQNGEIFAYLVEGYFDVISLHEKGFPNTVATCGTALTEDHIKLLKRYVNHIVLLRDTDPAGITAASKDIDHLLKADFRVSTIQLPTAKDIDEYARNYAPG